MVLYTILWKKKFGKWWVEPSVFMSKRDAERRATYHRGNINPAERNNFHEYKIIPLTLEVKK